MCAFTKLSTFVCWLFLVQGIWLAGISDAVPVPPPSLEAPSGPPPGDFRLPAGSVPFPYREGSNLFPVFPFTHHFQNGIEVDDGTVVTVLGNLDVPIPGWNGIWDMQGALTTGVVNSHAKWGHVLRPVNPLDIPPAALSELGRNPHFNNARGSAQTVPVVRLPYHFEPLHCKPPICDPFIGTYATSFEYEKGDDRLFGAALDFPIPLWPYGGGVRFPLQGGLNLLTAPVAVIYGQHMGPFDPFKGYVNKKLRQIENGRVPPNISPLASIAHSRVLPPGPEGDNYIELKQKAVQKFLSHQRGLNGRDQNGMNSNFGNGNSISSGMLLNQRANGNIGNMVSMSRMAGANMEGTKDQIDMLTMGVSMPDRGLMSSMSGLESQSGATGGAMASIIDTGAMNSFGSATQGGQGGPRGTGQGSQGVTRMAAGGVRRQGSQGMTRRAAVQRQGSQGMTRRAAAGAQRQIFSSLKQVAGSHPQSEPRNGIVRLIGRNRHKHMFNSKEMATDNEHQMRYKFNAQRLRMSPESAWSSREFITNSRQFSFSNNNRSSEKYIRGHRRPQNIPLSRLSHLNRAALLRRSM